MGKIEYSIILPILLLGATVAPTMPTISPTAMSSIGVVWRNVGSSALDLLLQFGPYIALLSGGLFLFSWLQKLVTGKMLSASGRTLAPSYSNRYMYMDGKKYIRKEEAEKREIRAGKKNGAWDFRDADTWKNPIKK